MMEELTKRQKVPLRSIAPKKLEHNSCHIILQVTIIIK